MAAADKIKEYPFVVTSLVIMLIFVAFHFLRGDVILTLEEREADLYGQIRVMEKNVLHANDLNSHIEQITQQVEGIDERLFDPAKSSLNARYFYSYEDRFDILIKEVTQGAADNPVLGPKGPKELKHFSVLSFSISVEAEFHELLRFMYQLSVEEPFMRISDFTLSQAVGAESSTLSSRISVLVMAQPAS